MPSTKKCVILIHTKDIFSMCHVQDENKKTMLFDTAIEAYAVCRVLDIYGPKIWEGYTACDVNAAIG